MFFGEPSSFFGMPSRGSGRVSGGCGDPFCADPWCCGAPQQPSRQQRERELRRRQLLEEQELLRRQQQLQQQQQQQQQYQRGSGPFGGSPNLLTRQQQQQLLMQQRQQQQQQARAMALAEQKQKEEERQHARRLQALKLRTYVRAATRIQRAWRAHHAAKVAAEREAAGRIVLHAIQAFPQVRSAKQILASLKQLRDVRKAVADVEKKYTSAAASKTTFLTMRDLLGFQDAIDRLIIKMDQIDTHGNTTVRARRKQNVEESQVVLQKIEAHMTKLKTAAATIQRWYRAALARKQQQRKQKAAAVITRAVRNYPRIVKAKKTLASLRKAAAIAKQVQQAKADFEKKIRQLQEELKVLGGAALTSTTSTSASTSTSTSTTSASSTSASASELPTTLSSSSASDSSSSSSTSTSSSSSSKKKKNKKNKKHKKSATTSTSSSSSSSSPQQTVAAEINALEAALRKTQQDIDSLLRSLSV